VVSWGNVAARREFYHIGGAQINVDVDWRPTGAVLLPDSSVVVALECSDRKLENLNQPKPSHTRYGKVAGLCRLVPPDFRLDPAFGGGGIELYVPGRDFQTREGQAPVRRTTELQMLTSLRAFADGSVLGALLLIDIFSIPSTNLFESADPDSLGFDGSVGVVRLA
jgi:hypothetical protein